MKIIKLALILLFMSSVLSFIKADKSIDIRQALPFCDGEPPNVYHVGALIMILIFLWGINRKGQDEDD
ncbi:hypothetical protein ACFL6U_23360 [Planctomycetota bacterium]